MHCEHCSSEHPASVPCDQQVTCSGAEFASPARRSVSTGKPPVVDLRGRTLGHYRLTRLLGSGGMGTVYLAEQTLIGARVAVKVLHPNLAQDARLRARFYAEARTVNLIGHPNIVRIFDISESEDGLHYFVMEHLEGQPLSRLPRPMEPGLVAWLLAQACDALEAVHRSGVVHRDLKPDNLLMVERPGERPALKVLDFGVAKALRDTGQEQTMAGQVLGTPAYMAPEQWSGQPVDGRSDLYSLGVTGYLLLTGQLPYPRGQLAELVLAPEPLPPLRPPHTLVPSVPEALSQALLRALARSPAERFATALDFKRALLSSVRPTLASRPTPPRAVQVPPLPPTSTPIPAAPPRPEPNDPTPLPTWTARVRRGGGSPGSVVVHCSELSRGGLFMCCAEPFPPLFTRLEFTLQLGGEEVECVGEVVRHVDSALARNWHMSPGVGLQFINPSARLRDMLMRLRSTRRPSAAPHSILAKEALAHI
ncbi:serine/threonine-protein kinase [Archangium lipolyticum]|uniref:serine/threonine-protein kinase n=1 Tax=Archangium lipolyticum TaxID=2970465 RepID=UPI00214A2D6E|nr:serine/threonine protein kinase [Archangium lipolyticum]